MSEAKPESIVPVIVDVGKTKKNRVKKLKQGEGPLMDEVEAVIDEVCESLGDQGKGKTILPVVLIYRERRKKKKSRLFPFPDVFGDD